MASILFLLERIYLTQPIHMQLSQKQKNFLNFIADFWKLVEIWNISNKNMTLIGQIFPKLRTAKNMVRYISKKLRFNGSFGKQHAKHAKTLLKFEWQHLYHINWSLCRHLTCKKSLLVICKISQLFPNTLGADSKYSLLNWDNLMQHIEMLLSEKRKAFPRLLSAFLKSSLNFEHFQKKCHSHSWGISEIMDSEKHG